MTSRRYVNDLSVCQGRRFSAEELRHLFRPNFETRSTVHDSLGCTCCQGIAGRNFTPQEDENGFVHLLPNTFELRARDPSLAAVGKYISLTFIRKIDHQEMLPATKPCSDDGSDDDDDADGE